MRCKKHPADATSSVGVCASCLRERLFTVIAAQAQAQRDCRLPNTEPSLPFPRSVSPYISRRKSDTAEWRPHGRHHRFYSTPQVGPTGSIASGDEKERKSKRGGVSSLFLGFFRSKSEKTGARPGTIYDPGTLVEAGCSVSSPSLFPVDFFTGRRKKNVRTFSVDQNKNGSRNGNRGMATRICRNGNRGMSPVRHSVDEDHGGSSGYSSESPWGWRQTPQKTPSKIHRTGGKAAAVHGIGVSGLKFCLSPLVRASPSCHRSQKGLPPAMVVARESRVLAKSHLSAAASFCKNRSRKLADFGISI